MELQRGLSIIDLPDEEEEEEEEEERWTIVDYLRGHWNDVNWKDIWKPLLAEFICGFIMNLFGCGAEVSSSNFGFGGKEPPPPEFDYGNTYQISVSLAFGLCYMLAVAMFQHLSGGYANPAVTLSKIIAGRVPIFQGLLYIPFQFGGGLVGSLVLKVLLPPLNHRDDVFPSRLYHSLKLWQGIIWEVILSFNITITYLVVTDNALPYYRSTASLLVGVAVSVNHLAALFATGGGANPARSLGAGVVSAVYDDLWVFIIFPFIGATIGFFFHHYILRIDLTKHQKEILKNEPQEL